MSWSRSYFSRDIVLISLYIQRSNKGGALIFKDPNRRCGAYSRAALIQVAALDRSFTLLTSSLIYY